MAGLTGPERPEPGLRGGEGAGEQGAGRGQLILVAGFALAVLLLALAVALNAATYTESFATRADGVDDRDVAAAQYGVERGVADLVGATNERQPNASYADRERLFQRALGNWTALADRQAATGATAVNVTLVDTTRGTRVWQNDSSRALVDDDGAANWTVADGVNATRAFELTVSRAALANDSCPSGCFAVVATNGNATWRATVTGNATTVTVTVDGPDGTGECSTRANETTVELSAGRLGGDPCPALSFAAGVDGPYDVAYEHGDEANGTYAFVVDGPISDDVFASPPGPHSHPAIWSAEVRVTYQTPSVSYARTVTVTPGEDDD